MSDKKTVVELEGKEPWREIIGEGWVWSARLKKMQWIGGVAIFGLVLSVTYDISSNFLAAAKPAERQRITALDRFKFEPLVTTINALKSTVSAKQQRPEFVNQQFHFSKWGIDAAKIGTFDNYADYITAQVDSLNENGKLIYQCDSFTTYAELSNKLNGETVYCKQGKSGIWYFVAVAEHADYPQTNVGLIKQHEKSGWTFHNITNLTLEVGYESIPRLLSKNNQALGGAIVSPWMIADSMSLDFPELFN